MSQSILLFNSHKQKQVGGSTYFLASRLSPTSTRRLRHFQAARSETRETTHNTITSATGYTVARRSHHFWQFPHRRTVSSPTPVPHRGYTASREALNPPPLPPPSWARTYSPCAGSNTAARRWQTPPLPPPRWAEGTPKPPPVPLRTPLRALAPPEGARPRSRRGVDRTRWGPPAAAPRLIAAANPAPPRRHSARPRPHVGSGRGRRRCPAPPGRSARRAPGPGTAVLPPARRGGGGGGGGGALAVLRSRGRKAKRLLRASHWQFKPQNQRVLQQNHDFFRSVATRLFCVINATLHRQALLRHSAPSAEARAKLKLNQIQPSLPSHPQSPAPRGPLGPAPHLGSSRNPADSNLLRRG